MTTTLIELDIRGNRAKLPFDAADIALAMEQLRDDVLNATWQKADLSAAKCSALAVGGLNAIYAAGVALPPMGAVLSRGILACMLASVAASDNRTSLFQAIRDALDQGEEPPSEELLARLAAIENGEQNPIELYIGVEPENADTVFELVLASLVRGLLGATHAAFNTVYEAEASNPLPGASDDIIEKTVELVVDQFLDDLNSRILTLQALCRDSAQSDSFVDHGLSMCQFSQSRLPRLARALARGQRVYNRRLAAGQGIKAERIGRTCIRGGTSLREAVAATIAAQRLALSVLRVDLSEKVVEVRALSAELEISGVLPNGLNRQIHQLATVEDGTFVEIDGRVLSTAAAVDAEDRLIGRIDLQDPSSEATITAFGFFIHPANVGITADTHVRLSGIYHPESDMNGGQPALVIDRFALVEIAKVQWRIAFLRLGFDWFPVFRNAHNLFWAIGPHVIGKTLDPANAGAAELIFLGYGPAAVKPEEIA